MNTLTTKNDIRSLIQSEKVIDQVSLAIPKFLTPDRLLRVALTTINTNPKLLECTRESLLASIMRAAQMGIEPDGHHGHLIPRYNKKSGGYEASFQPDYKGLVALVRRAKNVADIYAEIVYENDYIDIQKGLKRDLIHTQDIKSDRGEIIGVYAVILYKDSTAASWEYMTRADVEAVRARSESWRSHVANGYDTPWITDEGEMFKKTVLKRLFKLADLNRDEDELIKTIDNVRRLDDARVDTGEPPATPTAPIKRANIPAASTQAALPPQSAEADEPVINDKPTKSRKSKSKKPEKASPATPESLLSIATTRLQKLGYSIDDLRDVLAAENLDINDLSTLELVLDDTSSGEEPSNWQSALSSIEKNKAPTEN